MLATACGSAKILFEDAELAKLQGVLRADSIEWAEVVDDSRGAILVDIHFVPASGQPTRALN